MLRLLGVLLSTPCLAVLAGCSAGGSGGGGANPPASFFETEEYDANPGLGQIRASSAYAEGATGDGVRVGVIDTGIDIDHPEFAGAIAAASTDIVSGNPALVDDDDPAGHGTAVSGVAAARRNDALAHGVAFDSEILAVSAERTDSCLTGCVFDQGDVAEATDYAVANGAQVINYSIGGASAIDPTLEAALEDAVDAGVVLVFAAGNDGGADPTFPGRFASSGTADGRAIVVGAVDADDEITVFSNRAGASQNAYMVAPGVGIVAPAVGGGAGSFTGTSFSTPHVTGAVALLLEAFPSLSADEAVDLLFSTATDLGDTGTDATFGRGLVDLAAALQPQGALGVPAGTSATADLAPLDTTVLALGPAFGPGPGLGDAIFVDAYGRPFGLDLDRRVTSDDHSLDVARWLAPGARIETMSTPLGPASRLRLSLDDPDPAFAARGERGDVDGFALTTGLGEAGRLALVREWGIGGEFGLGASAPGLGATLMGGATVRSPFIAFTDGGDGVALGHEIADGVVLRVGFAEDRPSADVLDPGTRRVTVSELVTFWDGGASLGLQVGRLDEAASLLDATGGGAFALGGGGTTFFGLNGRLPLARRVALIGHAGYGATRPEGAGGGLVDDVSTLHSTAFALGLTGEETWLPGDRLAFVVAQPLRVEAGTATVDRPVAMSADGEILREVAEVDLASPGRELDLELAYHVDLAPGRVVGLNWLTQLQPGHDAEAAPAHAVAVTWRARF